MVNYILFLILLIIISLYSIVLSLKSRKKMISLLCSILLLLCALRYVTLIIFIKSSAGVFLYYIKNIIMLSAPSLTIVPIICLFITNNKKITKKIYALVILMLCIYSIIILKAPSAIVISDNIYKISIPLQWKYIIAIVQGLFSIYAVITSIRLTVDNKHFSIRALNIFYALACVFSIVEGFLLIYGIKLMPSPILSEFCVILYILLSLNFFTI